MAESRPWTPTLTGLSRTSAFHPKADIKALIAGHPSQWLLSTQSGRSGSSIFVDLAAVDGFLIPVSQGIGGAHAGILQVAIAKIKV
jgi:hypothetical protein